MIRRKKLNQVEKVRILDRLSHLLEQGYSIHQALEIISHSCSSRQKFWLDLISDQLENGSSVEEAFEKAYFSAYVTLMVAYAEQQGQLWSAFQKAGLWKQRRIEMKREWSKVLAYPGLLLLMMLLMMYLLFSLVIPQFEVMFSIFQVELPQSTTFLLGFVHFFFQSYWLLLAPTLFLILFLVLLFPLAKARLIQLLLRLPVLKRLLQSFFTIQFCHQLGYLLQAHVPLHQSLDLMAARSLSITIQQTLQRMMQRMMEGEGLGESIQHESLFLSELHPIIYYAERNGQLAEQLIHYGLYLEKEVMQQWTSRIKWVEPALLLGIGGFIAFLFLSLFLPIVELIELL